MYNDDLSAFECNVVFFSWCTGEFIEQTQRFMSETELTY